VSERGDQVQKLLAVLAKHSDLVAAAYEGSVSGGDRQRDAGIEALFALGALKPYDEDSYRLNPRLREFFADYFSSYHAFQALRRVSGTMRQAQEQWRELRRLKAAGAAKDQDRLYAALDESIVEMAYSIEHNLAMLHSLLSTQYGNVDDLNSKLRQNRYYARQVDQFLRDVQAIDAFVEQTSDEAVASGLAEVRNLVTRRLGAKGLAWTSQIKEAQAVISKRLFEAKLVEARLARLSRFSLWLTRHRTADGWELPVGGVGGRDGQCPVALIRPERVGMRMQPDVTDTDPSTWHNLLVAVSKMPLKKEPPTASGDAGPQLLIEDGETVVAESLDPVQRAIRELAAQASRSNEAISLLSWKRQRAELAEVSDEAWLMFSCMQLKGGGLQLRFAEHVELEPFPVNERFYDIEVRRAVEPSLPLVPSVPSAQPARVA
jgi:hypothetical protein